MAKNINTDTDTTATTTTTPAPRGVKFWTVTEGILGTAHLGRDGSLKDFRPARVDVDLVPGADGAMRGVIHATPAEGVTGISWTRWLAAVTETGRQVSPDGLDETVERKFRFTVEFGGELCFKQSRTSRTPAGVTEDRRQAELRRIEEEEVQWAKHLALFGEDLPGWLARRFADPLTGMTARVLGRCRRPDGRDEAACAVAEAWLTAETRPGAGTHRFLFQLVSEAGGTDKVLKAVVEADDARREARKVAKLIEPRG